METNLLNVMAGFEKLKSGTITIDGIIVNRLKSRLAETELILSSKLLNAIIQL